MDKIVDIPAEYLPSIEELPGDLAMIAKALTPYFPNQSLQITLVMAQIFRAQYLHIHNIDSIINKYRDDLIRSEYDRGVSVRDLGIKNHLGKSTIEKILRTPDHKHSNQTDDRQLTLF